MINAILNDVTRIDPVLAGLFLRKSKLIQYIFLIKWFTKKKTTYVSYKFNIQFRLKSIQSDVFI